VKYLVRDQQSGFRQADGEPLDGQGRALRPWALTANGDVVYADWKQQGSGLQGVFDRALGGMQRRTALHVYDKAMSQQRRRLFETELARDAGNHPECYRDAVNLVSQNLIDYVEQHEHAGSKGYAEAGQVIKQRCFNDTGSGRLGTADRGQAIAPENAWQEALQTLRNRDDIPKVIGIQVALANVLTRKLKLDDTRQAIYDGTAARVAPSQGHLYAWFDPKDRAVDGQRRGRQSAGGAQVTSTPGISKPGVVTRGDGAEERKRGIDEWKRVEGSDFVKGIDMRNLVFGAGRSGTTGELLKTYRTFGRNDDGESFKQYLLEIVVYLVGGGHHTCHEIFSVANLLIGSNGPRGGRAAGSISTLAREAYVPGKYVKHLPESYLKTEHFGRLKEKYYDIAMLGHLHGTFV